MRPERPENGAEKVFRVCGVECLAISDWNEHYIKEDNVKDIIIFDVTSQTYISWDEFLALKEHIDSSNPYEQARKSLKRLRYKVWKPVNTINKKMVAKTKRKITSGWPYKCAANQTDLPKPAK